MATPAVIVIISLRSVSEWISMEILCCRESQFRCLWVSLRQWLPLTEECLVWKTLRQWQCFNFAFSYFPFCDIKIPHFTISCKSVTLAVLNTEMDSRHCLGLYGHDSGASTMTRCGFWGWQYLYGEGETPKGAFCCRIGSKTVVHYSAHHVPCE